MATGLYDTGRNAFLTGSINWTSDTVACSLVHVSSGAAGTFYTVNLATDQFFSIVPAGSVVAGTIATPMNLSTKTATAGVAGCANIGGPATAFGAVTGAVIEAILIWKNTGSAATSQLIAYIDSSNATGLPLTPNGSAITLTIDPGANKLFKL